MPLGPLAGMMVDDMDLVLTRLVEGFALFEHEGWVRHYATRAAKLRTVCTGSDGGQRAVAENPRPVEWWAKLGPDLKR